MMPSEVIAELRSMGNPTNVAGMAWFGISSTGTLGIAVPPLRGLAKRIGRDHGMALALWDSGIHEARILAAFVDDPEQVTDEQMERWVAEFDSWDVCDQVCGSLFDQVPTAWEKAAAWSERDEEFVRRAAFSLMAYLAVHDKKAGNEPFLAFLPLIESKASDSRNFVKKAVNWALRQIGKRNLTLWEAASKTAARLAESGDAAARWVGKDALKELQSKRTEMEGRA